MADTYRYYLPFNNNLWKVTGFFAFVAIAGAIVPSFELHARRYIISNNTLLVGGLVISALFLMAALVLKLKSDTSKKNPHHLALMDRYLLFPTGKDAVIQANYTEIALVKNIGNKMNGDILQVKAKNNSFKSFYIQGKGFMSAQEFQNFEATLLSKLSSVKA